MTKPCKNLNQKYPKIWKKRRHYLAAWNLSYERVGSLKNGRNLFLIYNVYLFDTCCIQCKRVLWPSEKEKEIFLLYKNLYKYGRGKLCNFHSHKGGSLLQGLRRLDPPLGPQRHEWTFFGAHVWVWVAKIAPPNKNKNWRTN